MKKTIENRIKAFIGKSYASNRGKFYLLFVLLMVTLLINGCVNKSDPLSPQSNLLISERNFCVDFAPNPAYTLISGFEEMGKIAKIDRGRIVPVAIASDERIRDFALGVEYIIPGFADVYAQTGVIWAKAAAVGCTWGDIEPQPPIAGKHSYHWDVVDRVLLEYQQAGFQHFHIYVRCMNRWASSKPIKPIGGGSWLPKPEYMEDYKAFLRAFVQRYDTNNPNHAPGLLYPVEYWEIESEWGTGFWQGTLVEYLELLNIAYPTIKMANPRSNVILIGFFLAGVFEGHPDPREIPNTLAMMPAQQRRNTERYFADIKELLAHPNLFDVVEFHSLSDWSEIIGMSRFLRQTMHQYGYEKPIWVGDVNCTASPLVFWGIPVPPYTQKQKPAIDITLQALANPNHPRHEEVEMWLRAEQSEGLVKKTVLAMAEGLSGINIGNLKDEPIFGVLPQITGTTAFQGLIETRGFPPGPGEPRPPYYALKLLAEKLLGFSKVIPLNIGEGIYAYQFTVQGQPIYVLWYDDGKRYLPGDAKPTIQVEIRLPQRQYLLTETPITIDGLQTQVVMPSRGILKLRIGTVPLFLEPINEGMKTL